MVSAAVFGRTLEQGYQSGVANVDFGTNNGQCVASALHQELSSENSIRRTTRETIKRKLTARVLPITRSVESNGNKTVTQFQNEVPMAQPTSNISNVQRCTDGNDFPTPHNDQQRPIKKPHARTMKITVPGSKVGLLEIQDQPPTKRPRPILPRTVQSQIGNDTLTIFYYSSVFFFHKSYIFDGTKDSYSLFFSEKVNMQRRL